MKTLFSFIAVLLTFTTWSQVITILDQDFEANQMPAGWTQTAGTTTIWTFGSNIMPGNANFHVANFPNKAAIYNNPGAWADIESPWLKGYNSGKYANCEMRLRYHYALNNKGTQGKDQFNGTLTTSFYSIKNGVGYVGAVHRESTDPTYQWIKINPLVGNKSYFDMNNFRVVWKYTDNKGDRGWGAGIDDVALIIQPYNDACRDAIVVDKITYVNSKNPLGSTNDRGFIKTSNGGMNDGVWYTFTPKVSGKININVTPRSWKPEVALFTGNCEDLHFVSSVTYPNTYLQNQYVEAGKQYFINIGHESGKTDEPEEVFSISITGDPIFGIPKEQPKEKSENKPKKGFKLKEMKP